MTWKPILVLDDDHAIRRLVARELRHLDKNIEPFLQSTKEGALSLLASRDDWHCIISDWKLGFGKGTAEEFVDAALAAGYPTIVFSGSSGPPRFREMWIHKNYRQLLDWVQQQ